ncbi:polysaccharide deacetylase family protein [Myxococcota bacterium]|nr:polysaccharide deacetylase family protein [Myxococcota bacterium]MBU1430507.1 polysaccharide deacetylase family protein [Myxococcota bacterium]MBU1897203.1 polysaccharide deacetylase family protein [Myxococcota bacterium]
MDVDGLKHYYLIHGLDPAEATEAAWTLGVPRFLALFAEVGLPATFYCVAEDAIEHAARMREIVAAGHEIGNHTWHHRYDLSLLDEHSQRIEIGCGKDRLEQACGAAVVGFRAPGYHTNAQIQRLLMETGHRYESSAFPCAPYHLAKAGVMGLMRLRGKRSRSILGDPRVLMAPRAPYTAALADPYRAARAGEPEGLRHYPISVALGAPLIGTAFTALGQRGALAALKVGLKRHPHLTLEFHAVDLLGLEDGLDPALIAQPDLRVFTRKKRAIFHALLTHLKAEARIARLDALVE